MTVVQAQQGYNELNTWKLIFSDCTLAPKTILLLILKTALKTVLHI